MPTLVTYPNYNPNWRDDLKRRLEQHPEDRSALPPVPAFWDLTEREILLKLKPLSDRGTLALVGDTGSPHYGKFGIAAERLDLGVSYLFFNGAGKGNCAIYWDIMWQHFGIIPRHCRNCWKVVAKPKNVRDLVKTYWLLSHTTMKGKAGVDLREWTQGLYAAFIYGESFDEGKENWKTTAKALREIDPGMPVILKRACTEFEANFPTNLWDDERYKRLFQQYEKTEDRIWELLAPVDHLEAMQTEWIERYKMMSWVQTANMVGDTSYRELPGLENTILGVISKTYHKPEWLEE